MIISKTPLLYPYIDCRDYLIRIKNKLEGIEKVKEKL
jgi:hypothetical protein